MRATLNDSADSSSTSTGVGSPVSASTPSRVSSWGIGRSYPQRSPPNGAARRPAHYVGPVTAPVIATAAMVSDRLGELLESPVWDPLRQLLVFDDAPTGTVLTLGPAGVERVTVGGLVGFVALTTRADLLLVGSSTG